MKKVVLKYYNARNLGDDLFVHILKHRYRNTFDSDFPVGLGSYGTYADFKFKVGKVLARMDGKIGRCLHTSNLRIQSLLKKRDILVYVGGSIFMEKIGLDAWRRELGFYQGISRPYYILGSNFGPHHTDEFYDIIHKIVTGAADVCFRDRKSYELFKDIPCARVATDIAFILDSSLYKIKEEKIAVFSLIDGTNKFDNKTTTDYEATVRMLTTRLVTNGYKVVYMSFCEYEGDEIANKRILGGLPINISSNIEVFNYRGNLNDALSLLAASEIIVASRFHATILGLVFRKKVLPMAYSDKTTDILTDMAFPGTVVDIRKINEFDPMTFDYNTIPIMDVSEQRTLAEMQFQELDKVLVKRILDA